MNTRDKPSVESPVILVLFLLGSFLFGSVLIQDWFDNIDNQATFKQKIASIYEMASTKPEAKIIENEQGYGLKDAVSRLPTLIAAQNYLGAFQGTEPEAARYLVLMNSLETGRRHQSRENWQAIPNTVSKLYDIWLQFPLLVAGSSCTFCNNHSSKMKKLFELSSPLTQSQAAGLAQDVTYFASMVKNKNLSEQDIPLYASLHASLSAAGNSATSEQVGKILIEQQQWSDLNLWVDKGLNGGRALSGTDLSTLPRHIVITAWEQGVALGYDQASLTRYLVSSGHRPALRWLVWLLGTDYKYLHEYGFNRQQPQYVDISNQFTQFNGYKGKSLAQFYNANWQNIQWHEKTKTWLVK
jgi:hypothetical protein